METTIELGQRVRCRISGHTGIATGITQFMYGCRRILVQPEETKDGKPIEASWLDEPQLALVDEGLRTLATPTSNRHGPREDAVRAPDATR